jgi:hypothetical protein
MTLLRHFSPSKITLIIINFVIFIFLFFDYARFLRTSSGTNSCVYCRIVHISLWVLFCSRQELELSMEIDCRVGIMWQKEKCKPISQKPKWHNPQMPIIFKDADIRFIDIRTNLPNSDSQFLRQLIKFPYFYF